MGERRSEPIDKGLVYVIIAALIAVVVLVLFSKPAECGTLDDTKAIMEWLKEGPEGYTDRIIAAFGDNIQIVERQIIKKVDITKHGFKWRWDIHMASTTLLIKDGKVDTCKGLWLDVFEWQKLSRKDLSQFIQWHLVDDDGDSKPEDGWRNFFLHHEEVGRFSPKYPDGLLNMEWFRPPESAMQDRYDSEVVFWKQEIAR